MKNKVFTFAAFTERTILLNLVCVAIFVASHTALNATKYRLSISDGCCTTRSVIVLSGTEKDSLSSFKYFNFSFMERTMKNQSSTKYSNAELTSDYESVNPIFLSNFDALKKRHDEVMTKYIILMNKYTAIMTEYTIFRNSINNERCAQLLKDMREDEKNSAKFQQIEESESYRDMLIRLERYEDVIKYDKGRRFNDKSIA